MADTIKLDKIEFKNLPSGNTPVNDENLNTVQDNVEKFGNVISTNAAKKDKELEDTLVKQEKELNDLKLKHEQIMQDYDKKEVSGTSIHINDSLEYDMPISINGGIEQDTSEASINICPDKLEYWESGDYRNTNGDKITTPTRIRLKELQKVTPNTEYYFNHHFVTTETVSLAFVLRGYDKDKKFIENIGLVNNNSSKLMSENVEYIGVSLYNTKNIDNEVFETYKGLFESGKLKPFICLNSETDKSYVPYSINMPSIAFPSEVKGVSGHYDTVVENKNYFKLKKDYEQNGVKLTNLENGYFKVEGTPTAGSNFVLTENMYLQNQNNFSLEILEGTPTVWFWNDTDKNTNITLNSQNLLKKYNFDGVKVVRGAISCTTGTPISFVARVQIEQGDTKTSQVGHQEQLLPIDIPTGTVLYSGKAYKENGKWYRDVEYEEKVYNGTENWLMASDNNFYLEKEFESVYMIPTRNYCNMLKFGQNLDSVRASEENGFSYQNLGNGNIRLWVNAKTLGFTTVEEWKEFLASNNLKIVKYITTPTVEEITDTTLIEQLEALEKAQSYDGVTNVNSYGNEDAAPLVLSGEYVRSNKSKNQYSTDETVIGTWVDGKPLYRKVVVTKTNNSMIDASQIIGKMPTGSSIKSLRSCFTSENDGGKGAVAGGTHFSDTDYAWVYVDMNGDIKAKISSSTYVVRTINVIIEYTKSTD